MTIPVDDQSHTTVSGTFFPQVNVIVWILASGSQK